MVRVKRNPGAHSGVVRLCLLGACVGGWAGSARESEKHKAIYPVSADKQCGGVWPLRRALNV